MLFDVLPLRAIAFQFLFLVLAIALETRVFYQRLSFNYPTSVRYATSLNLFSTCIGWLLFFVVQPLLPETLKSQLISYLFFERFFPNPALYGVPPILVLLSLGIFIGTFLVELQGLIWLESLLESAPAVQIEDQSQIFMRSQAGGTLQQHRDKAYAVLVANAWSFSAILILLILRWLDQNRSLPNA